MYRWKSFLKFKIVYFRQRYLLLFTSLSSYIIVEWIGAYSILTNEQGVYKDTQNFRVRDNKISVSLAGYQNNTFIKRETISKKLSSKELFFKLICNFWIWNKPYDLLWSLLFW